MRCCTTSRPQARRQGSPLSRQILAASSWFGLVLGFASIAPTQKISALGLRDPFVPLLISLACALAFVASSAEPGRLVRRPVVVVWLSAIGCALLLAALSVFHRWSSIDLYPVSDQAVLEVYTLHAVRGIWMLGPYSQFGWHHPGPLYFYLLAPIYLLSGQSTIGLHVGAFVINLSSLCAIGYTLIRYAAPGVACATVLALGAYLLKLEPVISSYWNPHIVIVPAALYLVLTTAVASGRDAALAPCVLVGSFLVQTHISLAPYVFVLGSCALVAWWRERAETRDRSSTAWIQASACLLALLWLFPIVEQASHAPGNLTRIMRFFLAPSPGPDLPTSVVAWGDMICALFKGHLDVPEGLVFRTADHAITPASVGAIAQVVLLMAASFDALRRRDRFHATLSMAGLCASLVGLWSITRVKSLIGDYTIFWLSAVGTLNWALIAGLAITRVIGGRLRVIQQVVMLATAAIVLVWFIDVGSDQLRRTRRQGLRPAGGRARVIQLASKAIVEDMRRKHVQRPLFQMSTRDWTTAAGVLLQVYKAGKPLAVDGSPIFLFGEPLTPTGQEDYLFVIADARTDMLLTQQPGNELVANVEDMYIYARTLAR